MTLSWTVFQRQSQFLPSWNAVNGFEVFGADILFVREGKKPYLLEVNSQMSLDGRAYYAPAILDTILGNGNDLFKRVL